MANWQHGSGTTEHLVQRVFSRLQLPSRGSIWRKCRPVMEELSGICQVSPTRKIGACCRTPICGKAPVKCDSARRCCRVKKLVSDKLGARSLGQASRHDRLNQTFTRVTAQIHWPLIGRCTCVDRSFLRIGPVHHVFGCLHKRTPFQFYVLWAVTHYLILSKR